MAQPNLPAVTAIVVAAGASRRMGFDKLSYRLPDGRTVLETSCAALATHPAITQLVLVCGGNRAACEAIAAAGSSSRSPSGAYRSSIKLATKPTHWFSPFFRTV